MAVAVGLGSLDVPIPKSAGMVGTSWRFLHPVRPGDSLQTVWRLNRKRPVENPLVGLCFWQIEVTNQDSLVVATGEVGRLVQRRHLAELSADGADASAPAATRSRRRRRRSATAERAAEVVESKPLPEPANADVPAPSRRRRRRRNGNAQHAIGEQTESGSGGQGLSGRELEPAPAPAGEPGPASARRAGSEHGLRGVLRRLRGS